MTSKRIQNFFFLPFLFLILLGCHPYEKEIPTGSALQINNAYANPTYPHHHLTNVLLLPMQNPLDERFIEHYREPFSLSILRNFGKFNYFNLQFSKKVFDFVKPVINLSTEQVERVLLGSLGKEYNAQGALQFSVMDFSPYAPMHMRLKAAIFDTMTGEKIWSFDHVFDADDAETINGLRLFWNLRKAGGNHFNHFTISLLRPNFFLDYVFYSAAESYSRFRIINQESIKKRNQITKK